MISYIPIQDKNHAGKVAVKKVLGPGSWVLGSGFTQHPESGTRQQDLFIDLRPGVFK